MSYILDSLGNWKDESGSIITKSILEGQTAQLAQVVAGVKHTKTINVASYDVAPTTAACGWNNSTGSDVEYTQVDLVVNSEEVKQELCPKDLEDKYLAQYLRAGISGTEEVPFPESIAEGIASKVKRYVEEKLWSATIAGGDKFNGFSFLIDATNTPAVNAVSGAAAITTANALEEVDKMIFALPADAQEQEVLVFMSVANFAKYRAAYRNANLFITQGEELNGSVLTHPGFVNVKVVGTPGISGERVVAGPANGFYVGMDGLDDMDVISIFYSRDNDIVRVKTGFKYSSAIVFAELFSSNEL